MWGEQKCILGFGEETYRAKDTQEAWFASCEIILKETCDKLCGIVLSAFVFVDGQTKGGNL